MLHLIKEAKKYKYYFFLLSFVIFGMFFYHRASSSQTHDPKIDIKLLSEVKENQKQNKRTQVVVGYKKPEGIVVSNSKEQDAANKEIYHAAAGKILGKLSQDQYSLRYIYDVIPFLSLEIDEPGVNKLLAMNEVQYIQRNSYFEGQMLENKLLMNLKLSTQEKNYTGEGEQIAVIDSGVDDGHYFLANKVLAGQGVCYGGDCGSFTPGTPAMGAARPCTYNTGCDHGTTVASVLVGNPQMSGQTLTTEGGIAYMGSVLPIKTTTNVSGAPKSAYDDVLAAMQYIYGLRNNENHPSTIVFAAATSDVVSAQYCDGSSLPAVAAFPALLSSLDQAGIVMVAAAGNGSFNTKVSALGCLQGIIPAGATQENLSISPITNRDIRRTDMLLAPGQNINVANWTGGIYGGNPVIVNSSPTNGTTSLSTPMIGGAIALLQQSAKHAAIKQNKDIFTKALARTGFPVVDTSIAGNPVATAITPVNIDPTNGSPNPALVSATDYFMVQWKGYLRAPYDGDFQIRTKTDDGAKIYVNNELVMDRWINQSVSQNCCGTLAYRLKFGVDYPITILYYEATGVAQAKFDLFDLNLPAISPLNNFVYPQPNGQGGNGLNTTYYVNAQGASAPYGAYFPIYTSINIQKAIQYMEGRYGNFDVTTQCFNTSAAGNSTTCSHTPRVDPTITYEEFDQYEQNMVLVTIHYSSLSFASSVTYCGQPLTKLIAQPSGDHVKAEMWYLADPPLGQCNAVVNFPTNVGERLVTVTIIQNVLSEKDGYNSFVDPNTYFFAGPYSGDPSFIDIPMPGKYHAMPICAYTHYSEQNNGANYAHVQGPETRQITQFQPLTMSGQNVNYWGGIGAGRVIGGNGGERHLTWIMDEKQPYAVTCGNLYMGGRNELQMVGVSVPGLILVANGITTSSTVTSPNNKPVTISWAGKSVSGCTATGNWTGSKAVSGSEFTANLTANKTYTLTCNSAAGPVVRTLNVNVTTAPVVELRAEGVVSGATVDRGVAPTLNWKVTGATSCTASGGWSGTKAVAGGSEKVAAQMTSGSVTYTLTCTGAGGSSNASVVVYTTNKTPEAGFLAKYYLGSNFNVLYENPFAILLFYINLDLGTSTPPFPGMPTDYYSLRYSTQFTPQNTGTHQIITTSDEAVRVYLDDQPVIYNWLPHGRVQDVYNVSLVAGKQYNIVVESYERTGSATMILEIGFNGSPAGGTYKAVNVPLGMNGGGLKVDYFEDNARTIYRESERFVLNDYVAGTSGPNSNIFPHAANPYAKYSGTFTPTTTGTYSFTGVSTMTINNVVKNAVNGVITQAMTANVPYGISYDGSVATSVRWKVGTGAYSPLDFRNTRP